jgi:hypothetical protein
LASLRDLSRFGRSHVLNVGRAILLVAALAACCAAQELVQVLPKATRAPAVIEFLVTPWGLYPAALEVPPGDYVFVVRRKGFETPLSLTVVEATGRKTPIANLSQKARKRHEVVRLRPGNFYVQALGSTEGAYKSILRVDPRFVERSQTNDRSGSVVP